MAATGFIARSGLCSAVSSDSDLGGERSAVLLGSFLSWLRRLSYPSWIGFAGGKQQVLATERVAASVLAEESFLNSVGGGEMGLSRSLD